MTRTRLLSCVASAALLAACSKSAKNEPPASQAAAADDESSAPAERQARPPAGAKVFRGLPSPPREHWPCAMRGTADGKQAYWPLRYQGSPDSCWHEPEDWLPGCPTAVDTGGVNDMGYEYDEQGRVTRVLFGHLGHDVVYGEDGRMDRVGLNRFRLAGSTVEVFDGDTVLKTVTLDENQRPLEVRDVYLEETPALVKRFTHEGPRTRRYLEKVMTFTFDMEFVYECEDR